MVRVQRAAAPERPGIRTILRHIAVSLLVATVVPSTLFYLGMSVGGVWIALIVALAWCYGALAWRLSTNRKTSVLLWVVAVGLTGKTAIAFATGSTFIYFVQPAFTDATLATVFLLSLATARPAVARLAADFYPMTSDVAGRPRVKRLFWWLTVLWSGICAAKAGATLWMLHSLSLSTFVAAKAVLTPSVAALGAALTVALAVRVARREALLPAGRRTTALAVAA